MLSITHPYPLYAHTHRYELRSVFHPFITPNDPHELITCPHHQHAILFTLSEELDGFATLLEATHHLPTTPSFFHPLDTHELIAYLLHQLEDGHCQLLRYHPRRTHLADKHPVDETPPPEQHASKDDPFLDWIDIYLIDEDNQPVPYEDYTILLTNGSRQSGKLDKYGYARADHIPSGICQVLFPALDGSSVEGNQPFDLIEATALQPPKPAPRDWIEIYLIDEDEQPVGGEAYRILLTDGTEKTGNLDAYGYVRIDNLDSGICDVSFPNFDKSSVEEA